MNDFSRTRHSKSTARILGDRHPRLLYIFVICFTYLGILSSPASYAGNEKLTPIKMQLKWQHQFQFAGYYMAKHKGYYRQYGLDVEFIAATPDSDPIEAVLNGEADFGVGTSDLLLKFHQGHPVKVLGVLFQHSPLALVSLESSGIDTVQDLANRAMMIEPNSAEIYAYLKQSGLPLNSMQTANHSFQISELISGQVDAMSVYTTTEPFELYAKKIPYRIFTPRMGGIDFYGDNLFTTTQLINSNPKRVEQFTQASFEGWKYAMNHIEESIDIILASYPTNRSRQALRFEAETMQDLMRTDLIEPGYMTENRWYHIQSIYQELGLLDRQAEAQLEDFLYNPDAELNRLQSAMQWLILTVIGILAITGLTLYLLRRINQTRNQLAAMVQNSPIPILLLDEHLIIIEWNRQSEKVFGWSSHDVLGKDVIDTLVTKSHRAAVREVLKNTLKQQQSQTFSNKNLTKSGQLISCNWSNAPYHVQGERFVLCMAIDTSEIRELKAISLAKEDTQEECDLQKKQALLSGLVEITQLCLTIWEECTHTSKIQLADQSGLWRVSLDNGTAKTRTLDKYLSLETIPNNPRWKTVIQTANFIIRQCPDHPMTEKLKKLKLRHQHK